MNDDKSIEAIERTLGRPIGGELSENALRVRRNLLVASLISICAVIGGIRLDPNSTILGFRFLGLNDEIVRIGLAVVTCYLLVHFLWYVLEALLEWRIRITGTRLAFVTAAKVGSPHADYPDDPRQSTLYSWWSEHAKRIGNVGQKVIAIDEALAGWEDKLRAVREESGPEANLNEILSAINDTRTAIMELKRSVDLVQETLSAQRIAVSLRRFDGWFGLFMRSENLRWLLIDTLIPAIVGVWAVVLLIRHL